jgi:BirA family biotin operon repressor/biotin-[acetyl-CoA-carboxylase] ligase
MSVLLFPPPELAPLGPEAAGGCAWLTALAAVATAELVSSWSGREARIKWPNDVRVDGWKIAGILVERALRLEGTDPAAGTARARARGAVIGVGLNVNLAEEDFPANLRARATSLAILRGDEPVDRSDLARDLIRRLDAWYDRVLSHGPGALNGSWRTRSEHLGRPIRVVTREGTLHGRLVDLDLEGGLALELGQGLLRVPPGRVMALEA